MSTELPPTEPTAPPPAEGLSAEDRAFLLSLARQVALGSGVCVALAWLAHLAWAALVGDVTAGLGPGWSFPEGAAEPKNLGPLVVVCLGMIVAAVIDGWAFKVPNWLTLSLTVSGWLLGLAHDLGLRPDAGVGGVGAAVGCTLVGGLALGWLLLIGGMGQGDVKMQMGFASWMGAFYGFASGLWVVLPAFAVGVVVGGVFGLVMMGLRGQFYKNWKNTVEIGRDLQVLVTAGPERAVKRAQARYPERVRLPYGVPLCVGFVGYLFYLYLFNG